MKYPRINLAAGALFLIMKHHNSWTTKMVSNDRQACNSTCSLTSSKQATCLGKAHHCTWHLLGLCGYIASSCKLGNCSGYSPKTDSPTAHGQQPPCGKLGSLTFPYPCPPPITNDTLELCLGFPQGQ